MTGFHKNTLIATAFLIVLLGVQAGAQEMKKSDAFAKSSERAVVVIGFPKARGFKVDGYQANFFAYKIEEGQAVSGGKQFYIDDESYAGSSRMEYKVAPVDPGTYYLGYAVWRQTPDVLRECFSKGTISFEIKPGSVNYIGDILLSPDSIEYTVGDLADAQKTFRKYKNIEGVLERKDVTKIPRPNIPLKIDANNSC